MKSKAFTLMEMLVALAIIGLIIGGSMIAVGSLNDEKQLRDPLNELRIMGKRAWARSMEEQRAWQIKLLPDRFVLEPKQPVNPDDLKLFKDADKQLNRGSGVDTVMIKPEIRMEVRHWGEAEWHAPRPDTWVFEHSGLCEPINIRFISEFATIVVNFDPLTAAVASEEFLYANER
ncbi:MAG: Prepilin-type N-terminal cleavage/methylation protein [Verrucomicrobiales bacterium]|nr:Prepilin-type N-terminal cleavage/methylation protein [Verrucomicrobiales bacterium]